MKKLAFSILCILTGVSALAETPFKLVDTTKASIIIERPALQPVKPLVKSESDPIDTLDTASEFIKVVLYGDHTWEYHKLPGFVQDKDVFEKNWDSGCTNPYKMQYADMPYSWAIWLVDSLGQYHCPYQGDVHYRGKFGVRRGRRHQGIDLPLKTGTPIYAAFTGKVRVSQRMGGYGNIVIIRHENGIETFYGHLSERKVKAGDWVNAGEVIGLGGSTGRSTGPHLHFETRYQGFAFDPQWLIDFKTGELRHRLFILKKKFFDIHSNYAQNFEDEWKNEEDDKAEDAEKAAMRYYKIKSGDTLGSIARRNGTTVSALCKLNGITPKTTLRIGRTIRVK